MVSPRVWVSYAAGENARQSMPLAQQLISDLRNAGAEVASESATLPDEQFLPFLQRELASCQWFILVQTPQGMSSRRVQLAVQEALSRLEGGLLRGACLISASLDGWDELAPRPEIRSYAYDGDYPRLRDKLLLDLDLLQISNILEEAPGTGMSLPVQETSDFSWQAATGSAKRPVPFQERSKAMDQSSSSSQLLSSFGSMRQTGSMASQHPLKTGRGDRPVAPPLFIIPRPSRRFWLYSLVSIFSLVLIVSGTVLAKDLIPAPSPTAHPTPITLTHPSPTPAPTHIVPAQPPTQPVPTPAPTQPVPVQPAPTPIVQSCPGPLTPLSTTTGVGQGSTPAQVSITIWKDCNGDYYASVKSLQQSDGTAFTGTLVFTVINSTGSTDPPPVERTCGAGVCDTTHIQVGDPNSTVSWSYTAGNGWLFFSVSGAAQFAGDCNNPPPCASINSGSFDLSGNPV